MFPIKPVYFRAQSSDTTLYLDFGFDSRNQLHFRAESCQNSNLYNKNSRSLLHCCSAKSCVFDAKHDRCTCCAVSATAFLTASATACWAVSCAALAPASSPASAPACSAAPTVRASTTSASAALTASSSLSILTGAMFSLVSSAWISSAETFEWVSFTQWNL